MSKMTPLQLVNKDHGGKEKLVDKVVGLLEHGDESKAELTARLRGAANSKLLRLHDVVSSINDEHGSKEKFINALLRMMEREKDQDYREKLAEMSPTRLMDLFTTEQRKAKAQAAK